MANTVMFIVRVKRSGCITNSNNIQAILKLEPKRFPHEFNVDCAVIEGIKDDCKGLAQNGWKGRAAKNQEGERLHMEQFGDGKVVRVIALTSTFRPTRGHCLWEDGSLTMEFRREV